MNKFKIYGFNKSSEAGPDKFAFSIFLKGCNLRCPYCMNCNLVKRMKLLPICIEELERSIISSKPKVIMISGGEPTCTREKHLIDIINWGKNLNCSIGMSTNGTRPDKVEKFIPHLSYITMDLKSNARGYRTISREDPFFKITRTWEILRNEASVRNAFNYEIRTTLYPKLIPSFDTIKELAQLFRKGEKWLLQPFRQAKKMLKREAYHVQPYSESINMEIERIVKLNTEADVEIKYV